MWLVALSVPYCVEMGQKRHKRVREVRVGDFREKSARIGAKKSAQNENCKVTVYYAIASGNDSFKKGEYNCVDSE